MILIIPIRKKVKQIKEKNNNKREKIPKIIKNRKTF